MNPHDEQRLRDLLDGAVSDVEPREGLDAITSRISRTKVSSMSTRPWLYGVAGAVVATAATITAFAVIGNDTTPTSGPEPADAPSAAATKSATEQPTTDASPTDERPLLVTVPAYYVAETERGPRLYREFHEVEDQFPELAAVREAVTVEPFDPDYASPWINLGAGVGGVTHKGGTILVDLTGDLRDRPAALTRGEAAMAVEQVLYTVQAALQSRDPVQLLLNGERTDQVLGVPASEPLAQGDEMATLAQVWIIDPQHGDTVRSGAEVSGIGAFFEANVTWELRQGDQVVESGFTTAEQCCTMAPYTFPLPDVPAGDYVLVVSDSDASGGEGPAPFQDTKQITIR